MAAWNYFAMEQAIRDSGVEEKDIINERTGIAMGSGGLTQPSTIVEAADITREKRIAQSALGHSLFRKPMSSTASATLATWFKIKGVNYLDLVSLRDVQPLHRQCCRESSSGATRT